MSKEQEDRSENLDILELINEMGLWDWLKDPDSDVEGQFNRLFGEQFPRELEGLLRVLSQLQDGSKQINEVLDGQSESPWYRDAWKQKTMVYERGFFSVQNNRRQNEYYCLVGLQNYQGKIGLEMVVQDNYQDRLEEVSLVIVYWQDPSDGHERVAVGKYNRTTPGNNGEWRGVAQACKKSFDGTKGEWQSDEVTRGKMGFGCDIGSL